CAVCVTAVVTGVSTIVIEEGVYVLSQGQTDNSWGPRAIGDHGAPCPNSKKPMKKVPGASHGAPY
ncbi:unnamed protein product, partial [Staurois parvus]